MVEPRLEKKLAAAGLEQPLRLLRDAPACVSGLRCRSYRYASAVHDS